MSLTAIRREYKRRRLTMFKACRVRDLPEAVYVDPTGHIHQLLPIKP